MEHPLNKKYASNKEWKTLDLFFLRAFVLFFATLIIPFEHRFFENITKTFSDGFSYSDLDQFALYFPSFANNPQENNFTWWLIVFLACHILAAAWTFFDRKAKNYDKFYYWVRVIIRYRLAIAFFHFAWVKIFPLQMPFPSISHLNTPLGDFAAGKLFWATTGAAPGYEVFSGVFELIGALLLLRSKTTTLGAIWLTIIMVPISAINWFYDYGVILKSVNCLVMLLFLLVHDRQKLYNLLIRFESEELAHYRPTFSNKQRIIRLLGKTLFCILFIGVFGYEVGKSYYSGKSHMRQGIAKGISGMAGFYLVTEFSVDGKDLPYSPLNTIRWQNVIFEKWNVISIKTADSVKMLAKNKDRTIENFSTAGRHYFQYRYNPASKQIRLKNSAEPMNKDLIFSIRRIADDHVSLSGKLDNGKNIYVLLKKIDKKYPLIEGRVNGVYSSF